MSKHHWTSQKIITVRESIDDTKLTRIVHYITEDRTMVRRMTTARRKYASPSEEFAAKMREEANAKARAKARAEKNKKPVNVRDRSNTSRVGVGTIDKKPTPTATPKKQTATSKTPIQQERTTQNPTQKTTPNKTQAELTREKYLRKSPTTTTTTKSRAGETQEEKVARFKIENKARLAASAEKGAAQRAKVKKFVTGIGSSISGKFKELRAKEKARLEAQKAARLAKAEEKRKAQLKVTQEREKKRQERAETEANRPETQTEKNIRLIKEKAAKRKAELGYKKGGMVKKKTAAKKTTRKPAARVAKKGIDGVALRGKTRAARSR